MGGLNARPSSVSRPRSAAVLSATARAGTNPNATPLASRSIGHRFMRAPPLHAQQTGVSTVELWQTGVKTRAETPDWDAWGGLAEARVPGIVSVQRTVPGTRGMHPRCIQRRAAAPLQDLLVPCRLIGE